MSSRLSPSAIETITYTTAFDYDGNSNLIYQGQTVPGKAKSAATWKIKKFTYDGNGNLTDIQFSGGTETYTYIWNDRASYSYS